MEQLLGINADMKKTFGLKGITPLVAQRREPHRFPFPGWRWHMADIKITRSFYDIWPNKKR